MKTNSRGVGKNRSCSKKNSDKIWAEFKAACNAYFDKLRTKSERIMLKKWLL
jgi:hypothetical protein